MDANEHFEAVADLFRESTGMLAPGKDDAYMAATEITDWKQAIPLLLPLLLSEPELVASLPDEVRLSVLTPRERMALEIGLLNLDLAAPRALTPEGKEPNAETARAIEEGRQGINVTEGLPDGE